MDSIKRLNYFNHQFLKEEDFRDEQTYHMEMRKRHNRVFHSSGVADGLEVERGDKKGHISITKGMALDSKGSEIIVLEAYPVDLSDSKNKTKKVDVWIRYAEEKTDEYTALGEKIVEKVRISEGFKVNFSTNNQPPPEEGGHKYLFLASVLIDKEGAVEKIKIDTEDRRKKAGVVTEVAEVAEVTLKSIEALSTNGGEIRGKLSVVHPNATALEASSQGKGPACRVNLMSNFKKNILGLLVNVSRSGKPEKEPCSAAVAAVSELKDVVGIYAYSKRGTFAAFIEGNMKVDGNVEADNVKAPAIHSGHITDVFVNASQLDLLPGHVVQLSGSPVNRYRSGNIPVPEIVPTDSPCSTRVVGVVDGPVKPCNEEESSDQTEALTAPGEECYVVILGCYSQCKVDATAAPIEVGDLLTSSTKLGYAMKALEPKPGCIIGKALSPLSSGQGDIPVILSGVF